MDWRAAIPPEVPDPENFVKHPVFDDLVALEEQLGPSALFEGAPGKPGADSWLLGVPATFSELFDAGGDPLEEEAARSLVRAFLDEREDVLAQLAEAARRPRCRFLFDYERGGFFGEDPSNLALVCRRGASFFTWRGLEALHRGAAHQAWLDWESAHHLGRHVSRGPGLLYAMVGHCVSMQLLWEGLRMRRFETFQLERMDDWLAHRRLDQALLRQLREERAGVVFLVEECLIGGRPLSAGFADPFVGLGDLQRWRLSGWLYRNLIRYCHWMQEYALALEGVPVSRIELSALEGLDDAVEQSRWFGRTGLPDPRSALTVVVVPAFGGVIRMFLREQVYLDLARLAMANERRRLRLGAFAETLEDLRADWRGGEFPRDRISKGSYRYRLETGEWPVIYGVGF